MEQIIVAADYIAIKLIISEELHVVNAGIIQSQRVVGFDPSIQQVATAGIEGMAICI
jgi:hypothetical protein